MNNRQEFERCGALEAKQRQAEWEAQTGNRHFQAPRAPKMIVSFHYCYNRVIVSDSAGFREYYTTRASVARLRRVMRDLLDTGRARASFFQGGIAWEVREAQSQPALA